MASIFDVLQPTPQRGLPAVALGQMAGQPAGPGPQGITGALGRGLLGASGFAQQNLGAFFEPQFESGTDAFLSGLLGTTLAGIGGPSRQAQANELERQQKAEALQARMLQQAFPDMTPESQEEVLAKAGMPGIQMEREPVEMEPVTKEFMQETFDAAASVYTNRAASIEDRGLATGYLKKASKALGLDNEELFASLDLMSQLKLPFKGLGRIAKERAMSPKERMAAQDRAIIEGMYETGQAPDITTAEQMYFGRKKDETAFANYKTYFGQAAGGTPLNKGGIMVDLIKSGIAADPLGMTVYMSQDPEMVKKYANVADNIMRYSGIVNEKGDLNIDISPRREEFKFGNIPGGGGGANFRGVTGGGSSTGTPALAPTPVMTESQASDQAAIDVMVQEGIVPPGTPIPVVNGILERWIRSAPDSLTYFRPKWQQRKAQLMGGGR